MRQQILTISLCCVFILSALSDVLSQPLHRTDLSNLRVNAFAQDSLGYIWIATANGLCKSFGESYDVFFYDEADEHSIPSNLITGLYVDDASKLWISTGKGICSMARGKYEFHRYSQSTSTGMESFFLGFVQYAGRIYTYGYNGLYEIDEKNKTLIPRIEVDRQVIYGAVTDSHGNLWLTNGAELIKLDRSLSLISKIVVGRDDVVNCMVSDREKILLGTENGIKLLDLHSLEISDGDFPHALDDLRINQMLPVDGGRKLLISTRNKGALVYDMETRDVISRYNNDEFADIPSVDINTAFVDKEKNVWFGTFDRGHFMLSNKKKIFNENKAIVNLFRNRFVTRITADRYGNMWIGTRYDGLAYYNTATGKVVWYDASTTPWLSVFNSNFVQEIYCDTRNRLWVGYGNLLIVCNIGRDGQLSLVKTCSGTGDVVTIAEDANRRIWAGSSENGLYIYDDDLILKQHITSAVSNSNNITKIIPLSDDKMLFSAYMDNIYVIDANSLVASALDAKCRKLWSNAVELRLDAKGNLWIGTYGNGLMKYDLKKKTLKQYDPLQRNDMVGIECDAHDNVWASSSYGIYRISPADTINVYLQQDGIGGNQYHEKCTFKDSRGHIYFGGNTGLKEVFPDNVEPVRQDIPIYLTDFKLFGNSVVPEDGGVIDRDISLIRNLKLDHDENVVSFEFSGIAYDCLSFLEYAYMLEGFDHTWNYIGKYNRATYANLPAGSYTFLVKAKNRNGAWGEPRKLLDVEVSPAPWLHPLALSVYAVLAVLLVFLFSKLYVRLKLAKEKYTLIEAKIEQEHKMSQMKVNFFTNISHELRTPLTLIYAPVKMLKDKYRTLSEQQVESNLDFIAGNVDRLLDLTDQLLKFRHVKDETLPLKVSRHDCVHQLENIIKLYNIYTAEKNQIVEFDCPYDSLTVIYDADKLDKIMNNLLMNATKYTLDSGRIIVKLDLTKYPERTTGNDWTYMEIRVTDNGIGIDKNDFTRLFKRFSRLVTPSKYGQIKGFGIGLNYVYHLVENHKGKIRAERNVSRGMTFTVVIPVCESAYSEDERASDDMDMKQEAEQAAGSDILPAIPVTDDAAEEEAAGAERRKILIIEDNPDMNAFIAGLFSDKFDVTTAFDGLNGLQRAVETVPDIIISDVLMPRMDGYELCSEVKKNKDICHIPVILLTAKVMDEEQIRGYDQGADMYLSKPFNPSVLISIVNRMMAKQDKLKVLLISACGAQDSVPAEKDVRLELSPLDRKFLDKLYKYIEDNIPNDDININILSRELGYSRANFYRKIKALTGATPNDLLKTYRLNRAAELILTREYTLGEISEMTGFGTQSHFSNLFKKHFGISPKEYLTEHFGK